MSKKKEKEEEDVVDFSEISKSVLGTEDSLAALEGETFIIRNVEWRQTRLGEAALIEVEHKGTIKKYHTFSRVLIDQLKEIEEYLNQGKKVRVTLERRKRYYTFT